MTGTALAVQLRVSYAKVAFKGRVADGEVPGFRPKWKRGFGRWVGEVLVWAKAPSLFRNELLAADGIAAEPRTASPADKVSRLGHGPVIVVVAAAGARIEVAVVAGKRDRALGPFAGPAPARPGGSEGQGEPATVTDA